MTDHLFTFLAILSILVCVAGAAAAALNCQHANHPPSVHEPRENARGHRVAGAALALVGIAVGYRYLYLPWKHPHGHELGPAAFVLLVAILVVVSVLAGLTIGRARDNQRQRRQAMVRWERAAGVGR
ncbi:MAG TPA: hypothetical protein VEA69_16940 [Tepidisphaeraceae bacterium]|nr:hypothetical protein [Tepidisphaeraceae bacterium]